MPRNRQSPAAGASAPPPAPHVIISSAVYTVAEARAALHLKNSTIRREVRAGRLCVAKRAGRYYLLGEWLLDWIRGGALRPRQQKAACTCASEEVSR
jgi:hypothetical protein